MSVMVKNSNYINMVKAIALSDLKLKYQGSFLGYVWSLVKPLMLFSVLYLVFTRFFRIGGDVPNYPVYLLLGIVMWTFFAEITSVCMGSIVSKGALIRKVYFPRILLVVSNSITSLITFSLNLVIVFVFIGFSDIVLGSKALLFILLVLELYVFVLGLALGLSALYVKFRDIAHIWEVVLQVLFYATPILYPLSFVPDTFAKYIALSPLAQIIQDARFLLVTDETIRVTQILAFPYYLIPYLIPFVIFGLGLLVFNNMSAKFAEEV